MIPTYRAIRFQMSFGSNLHAAYQAGLQRGHAYLSGTDHSGLADYSRVDSLSSFFGSEPDSVVIHPSNNKKKVPVKQPKVRGESAMKVVPSKPVYTASDFPSFPSLRHLGPSDFNYCKQSITTIK